MHLEDKVAVRLTPLLLDRRKQPAILPECFHRSSVFECSATANTHTLTFEPTSTPTISTLVTPPIATSVANQFASLVHLRADLAVFVGGGGGGGGHLEFSLSTLVAGTAEPLSIDQLVPAPAVMRCGSAHVARPTRHLGVIVLPDEGDGKAGACAGSRR
jgi:hypothetical protein